MKQQHQAFIEAMAEHGNPAKAYLAAYPNAKETSARTAAYRLLQIPEIATAVAFDANHLHKKAKAAAMKKGRQRVAQQLADVQSRREVLASIIFGTAKRKRIFKVEGELFEAEEDHTSSSLLRTIELDCKLEAGYDWTGVRKTTQGKDAARAVADKPQTTLGPADATHRVILIGDCFFGPDQSEWFENYIAWKKQNPAKVKEHYIPTAGRIDTYIEWNEDPGKKEGVTRHIIHIMRFPEGFPRGPFIPGESRYFKTREEQQAAYAALHHMKSNLPVEPANTTTTGGTGNTTHNSPLPLSGSDVISETNNSGGRSDEGGTVGSISDTGITPIQTQQNVTIPPPPNPPQEPLMPQNRKIYTTTDEIWEAYVRLLPAWPHMSQKARRGFERSFRETSISCQRQCLSFRQQVMGHKNSAA